MTIAEHHLPDAVDGERLQTRHADAELAYYRAGEGPPLLLVHSINAAASVAEVAPLFEHARQRHTVYAPDLPGFGHSDRSDRDYSVDLYTGAVEHMLDVIAEQKGDVPVHVLGLSLGCEFVARAAASRPERCRSLTLVNPTGFTARSSTLRAPEGSTREMAWFHRLLRWPVWSQTLFDLLTRPGTIRYFLERTFGGKAIDETLWRYCCTTAQQTGARFAPLAFLSGRLFSRDIRTIYERLHMPVWLAHGTRGDFRDFSGAVWTADADNWQVDAFETGALPYFEQPERFLELWDAFLRSA